MFAIQDDMIDSGQPWAAGLIASARAEAHRATVIASGNEVGRLRQILDAALPFCGVALEDIITGAESDGAQCLLAQIKEEARKQQEQGYFAFADALREAGDDLARARSAGYEEVERLRAAVTKARHLTTNLEVQRWLDAALCEGARVISNQGHVIY